jgi:hypothetical protein
LTASAGQNRIEKRCGIGKLGVFPMPGTEVLFNQEYCFISGTVYQEYCFISGTVYQEYCFIRSTVL